MAQWDIAKRVRACKPCGRLEAVGCDTRLRKKNQIKIPIEQFPQLLRDIDNYSNTGGNVLTTAALRLMALTFVRTQELIAAPRSEFDLKAGLWRIPANRMKKDTPHLAPLARQTVALLKDLHQISGGSTYLFPSQNGGGKTMSNNTILFALYRMGYKGRMTGHGFRGLASTEINEQKKYPDTIIELQLSHLVGNAVKRAYDHSTHMPERIAMMQDWANFIDAQRGKGQVIPMKRA